MTDFTQARRTMVDSQLRTAGVIDWQILEAANRIPREKFIPESHMAFAYSEEAIPVSPTRVMASPAAMGKLLQLAQIGTEDAVLDVGACTGYSTALIAQFAGRVVALEAEPALAAKAGALLEELRITNAKAIAGPFEDGAPGEAPFDVIVLEGAVDQVPESLLSQLGTGGRLVAVTGTGGAAVAHIHLRHASGVSSTASININLPVLGRFAPVEAFVF